VFTLRSGADLIARHGSTPRGIPEIRTNRNSHIAYALSIGAKINYLG